LIKHREDRKKTTMMMASKDDNKRKYATDGAEEEADEAPLKKNMIGGNDHSDDGDDHCDDSNDDGYSSSSSSTNNDYHYVRKAHLRRVCTKNGDTQITSLCCRVSHYRVIGDARPGASSISIYGRRATSGRITYLISGWGPYATNLIHVLRMCISYF
jgi:hypothetical protein